MLLQAAQVYAASIMFGYFVRRVDKRFQLERQLGLLKDQQADAVARLERLFSATDGDEEQDPDQAAPPSPSSSQPTPSPSTSGSNTQSSSASSAASRGEAAGLGQGKKKDSPLRTYIESFDQATLADMTRQVVRASLLQTHLHLSAACIIAASCAAHLHQLRHCPLHLWDTPFQNAEPVSLHAHFAAAAYLPTDVAFGLVCQGMHPCQNTQGAILSLQS